MIESVLLFFSVILLLMAGFPVAFTLGGVALIFAETDLLGVLSACPGGDCGSEHSSDVAKCYPLKVSIWTVDPKYLTDIKPSAVSSYNRNHGID